MNESPALQDKQSEVKVSLNRLPIHRRTSAAIKKYAKAVELYATTDMPIRLIAEASDVTSRGLSRHLGTHYRHLLYARYGIKPNEQSSFRSCIKPSKGQSRMTHLKYKDAVLACNDIAYIEYNVSQIARMFGLDGTALASQLRLHYPNVIPDRERVRHKLGLADNIHRGVRKMSEEKYSKAADMYKNSDLSIGEVADRCGVSEGGLSQFMRFYCQDIIAAKATRRSEAKSGEKIQGSISGTGVAYGPKPETVAYYSDALELYRTTAMTIEEISEKTGVSSGGFQGYLRRWCQEDVICRRQRPGRTARKYFEAIESLRKDSSDVSKTARKFGLDPDIFRQYLAKHEPELTQKHGMITLADGKRVKRASYDKYRTAIEDYATSSDSIKVIAGRHGIAYQTLVGFILRHCPEERKRHKQLVSMNNS